MQDEAFDLWTEEWGSLYEQESESKKVLREVRDTWFLVSVVENDYINGNLFSAFDIAPVANVKATPAANGTPNGTASTQEKAMPAHVGGSATEERTATGVN